MKKEGKVQMVADIAAKLADCKAAFLADYRGLSVEQVEQLRAELRAAGVEYRVIKNTLLRLAAKGTATIRLLRPRFWLNLPRNARPSNSRRVP